MDRLTIWNSDKIINTIALCLDKPWKTKQEEFTKYRFPLTDILFMFYKEAVISESFYSLDSLYKLREEYNREHQEFHFSVEELIQEGWFFVSFGRWTTALSSLYGWKEVKNITQEEFPEADVIRFLIWLKEKEKEDSFNIEIENPEAKLEYWRMVCRETPELEWFVKEHWIVGHHGKYYAYNAYSWNPEVNLALAKLWMEWKDTKRAEWLSVARSLNGTSNILNYLEYKPRQELLQFLLTDCLYQYPIPSLEEANSYNQKLRILEAPKYCQNPEKYVLDGLWTGNLVLDTIAYGRYGFQHYRWCPQKAEDDYLILGSVLTHFEECHKNQKDKILSAYLNGYDKTAALYLIWTLSPNTIYELLINKGTFFLGFRHLISDMGNVILDENAYAENVMTAMSEILKAGSKHMDFLDAAQIGMCLFYLHKQAGGKRNRYKGLLERFLRLLGTADYLDLTGEGLTQYFKELLQLKRDIDWVSGFHLLLTCVNQWFMDAPELQKKGYFDKFLDLVWEGYQAVFNGKSNYVTCLKADYFSPKLCAVLYKHYIRNQGIERRRQLLFPKHKLQYKEKQNQIYYFYRLLLEILYYMYEEEKDEAVKSALLEILELVLLYDEESGANVIFDYINMQIFSTEGIIQKCIAILQYKSEETRYLVTKLLDAKVPELLVYYDAAADKELKEAFLEQINKKADKDSLNICYDERAINLIMDHQIECLYPAAENSLELKLGQWDKKGVFPKSGFYQNAIHQKWRLKYYQGKYDDILEGDNFFFKAIVYMEAEEYEDFQKADFIWKKLVEEREQYDYASSVYLNYFCLLNRELEKKGQEDTEKVRYILKQVKWLMNIIESEQIKKWSSEELDSYGWMVVQNKKLQGEDYLQELYLYKRKYHLSLTTDSFVESEKESTEILIDKEQKNSEDSDKVIVNALQSFEVLDRQAKGRIYYQAKGIAGRSEVNMGTAILVEVVLKTCCALQNYGPQLLYEDKLYEDRVTELFREMFNLAFGKFYSFTVHDQEKRGTTGVLHQGSQSPAEIDLSVYYNGTCSEIIEALVLKDNTSGKVLKDHIGKVLGNNIAHWPLAFMLVYGNLTNSAKGWSKYQNYLENQMPEEFSKEILVKSELLEIKDAPYYLEEFGESFHGIELLRQRIELASGGSREILHVFVDIAKNEEGKIRRRTKVLKL